MNRILFKTCLFAFLCFGFTNHALNGQSTFGEILTILDNNGCSSSYCHGAGAGNLFLTSDASDTYSNLVNVDPDNSMASETGNKLVMPGYPERSFLYRKINDHLYADSEIQEGEELEGATMPLNGTPMSNRDKEMIRQWILYGAPETGKAFSDGTKQAITDYHTDGGVEPVEPPPAPPEGEGFQVHYGPIFLQPGEEVEYLKKYDLGLEEDIEVNRLELVMSDFSHHFILYTYTEQSASNVEEGLRRESDQIFESSLLSPDSKMITTWQDNVDFPLPPGTAYKWEAGTVLDLDYHILNYDQSSPLAANLYLNIYTQPAGTAEKEMESELLIANQVIQLPPNSIFDAPTTYEDFISKNQDINLWNITPHTHKFGTDYDVFIKNPDNSYGIQILEGQYDFDYNTFTGNYDYEHPPIRFFDNFLEIDKTTGLIQQTTYHNTSEDWIYWGVTTADEMMISIVQYTVGENHQEDMVMNDIPSIYCVTDDPVELTENFASGAVGSKFGVTHNIFDPAASGVGTETIYANCCDPDKMTEIVVEVLPELEGALDITNQTMGAGTANLLATYSIEEDSLNENISYQWYKNGEIIDGATTPDYAAEFNATYKVEINNGACKTSTDFEVTEAINTSIESLKTISFSATPNPFSNQSRIAFTLTKTSDVLAEIYDLSGKQIAVLNNSQLSAGEHNFDFSEEKAGVYLLKLQIDDQTYSHQLIKQ